MAEVEAWKDGYFPRDRLRGYLETRGLWDDSREEELVLQIENNIKSAIKR